VDLILEDFGFFYQRLEHKLFHGIIWDESARVVV
jgi:hypothetical protein